MRERIAFRAEQVSLGQIQSLEPDSKCPTGELQQPGGLCVVEVGHRAVARYDEAEALAPKFVVQASVVGNEDNILKLLPR